MVRGNFRSQMEGLQIPLNGLRFTFRHFIEVIHFDTREHLGDTGSRPEDFDARNAAGLPKTNFLTERRRTEAPARSHSLVIGALPAAGIYEYADANSHCGPV